MTARARMPAAQTARARMAAARHAGEGAARPPLARAAPGAA